MATTEKFRFVTQSNRVKGIAFHPHRPWVLSSLHNGTIQLWDYRLRTLLDTFHEHDGPVRGIAFHPTQPLFVSGGDDYKIKVWNIKQRRCLFTLVGHLDYIRTVSFHNEEPWILSASDDQTIRVWNWQNRQSVAVLTGHNHYVMSAAFHPREDLIVSASLDQTVRVWDISGIRKKSVQSSHDDPLRQQQHDLFGNAEATVRFMLEGHDRGVNWAAFHPTLPLIVSGADDRQIKLWRMNDTKAWEVETFRGHYNNISCCLFHPRADLILSNSEDRTIRVWDISKRTCVQTFRREHDRFWILACHPELNIFAAGHDSGMVIFKLERERPAYTVHNHLLIYIKDRLVRQLDLSNGKETPLANARSSAASASGAGGGGGGGGGYGSPYGGSALNNQGGSRSGYRSLAYSADASALLAVTDGEARSYDLYPLAPNVRPDQVEVRRGSAAHAVFVSRNRFIAFDKAGGLRLCDTATGEVKKPVQIEGISGVVDSIYRVPTAGCILVRTDDRLYMYDAQTRRVMAEIPSPAIKFVEWSNTPDKLVALISKDSIVICNRQLEQLASFHEAMRIKSAVWDENGVLLYNTSTHLKFALPNGDRGIVRTLDVALYLTFVRGNRLFCLDRDAKVRALAIDNTEYLFKLALVKRNFTEVLRMVKESNLIGNSIIGYLQKKGFPDVALHFVKDDKTRFALALECGNIDIALEAAKTVDEPECWHRLGVEALRHGNMQIVEMAYQRTKSFERLSFLYLVGGNTYKLQRMLKIAEMRGDVMSRFHNALYLGDAAERVKVLEEAGQLTLAFTCAAVHGLADDAERLAALLGDKRPRTLPPTAGSLLRPPQPVLVSADANWPTLAVQKSFFDGALAAAASAAVGGVDLSKLAPAGDVPAVDAAAWGGGGDLDLGDDELGRAALDPADDPLGLGVPADAAALGGAPAAPAGGWGLEGLDELDVQLPDDASVAGGAASAAASSSASSYRAAPLPGPQPTAAWSRSRLPADHVAAGSLDTAMQLLSQQAGVVNFAPLRPLMAQVFAAPRATLPGLPGLTPMSVLLQRELPSGPARGGLPVVVTAGLGPVVDRLKQAYALFAQGPSPQLLTAFRSLLLALPLVVLDNLGEIDEAKQLLVLAREYVNGLRMELQRKDLTAAGPAADAGRCLELAVYFTHSGMQMAHVELALQVAMISAFKVKNFAMAGALARRLLELNPRPEAAAQAKKVALNAERQTTDAVVIRYDPLNPFVVCALSFVPIYKGSPSVSCPYCASSFLPEHAGKLCPTCTLSQIGKPSSGLVWCANVRQ